MELFLCALGLVLAGGTLGLLAPGKAGRSAGPLGILAGSGLGLAATLRLLAAGEFPRLDLDWGLPVGSFSLGFDPLTLVFLLPCFTLGLACSLYGLGALANSPERKVRAHWFFFSLLVAGLALVAAARDGFLFLLSWEAMGLAPFFLVSFSDLKREVREAAWTYLVASHLGVLALVAFFAWMGNAAGSTHFDALAELAPRLVRTWPLFLLALAGFGAKAGLAPLHVWLPEAHPAAPSHVSAFMSGALITAGMYGVARTVALLGPGPAWWGGLLLGLGLLSALLGLAQGLAQGQMKRLLAYSSIENAGIVFLGLGASLLASRGGLAAAALLAAVGALLHVLNHALFKGLLFLGAGAVLHSAGTVEISSLGGLLKRMPRTGALFLVGSAAITALPPLNGFFSELLIYLGLGQAGLGLPPAGRLAAWGGMAGLALAGGLALAALAKSFGLAFLGEPRTPAAKLAHDPSRSELAAMLLLALGCAGMGLAAPWLVTILAPAASQVAHIPGRDALGAAAAAASLLRTVLIAALPLPLLGLFLWWLRKRLLAGRSVGSGPTWDCGYARPSATMQYGPASFADPLAEALGPACGMEEDLVRPQGLFPRRAWHRVAAPDLVLEKGFRPVFGAALWAAEHLKWLQHGRIPFYVLSILAALVAVLAWVLA
jgi:hydrogenase-4 component B